jgi:hypothetical protein
MERPATDFKRIEAHSGRYAQQTSPAGSRVMRGDAVEPYSRLGAFDAELRGFENQW